MRAAVGLMLFMVTAAQADPLTSGLHQRLSLPSPDTMAARYAEEHNDPALMGRDPRTPGYVPSQSGFAIGPLRADGTETISIGRHKGPKPRYRLEGVTFLGGSVGGSIDGRGAMLNLHWHDSN